MPDTSGERSRGKLALDGAAWGVGFVLASLIVGGAAKWLWHKATDKSVGDDDDGPNELDEGDD